MRKFIFGLTLIAFFIGFAQENQNIKELSLEECIDIAVTRNLTIKQNQNNLLAAQSNKRQAFYNFSQILIFRVDIL